MTDYTATAYATLMTTVIADTYHEALALLDDTPVELDWVLPDLPPEIHVNTDDAVQDGDRWNFSSTVAVVLRHDVDPEFPDVGMEGHLESLALTIDEDCNTDRIRHVLGDWSLESIEPS